jgi:predicted hydrocarbon binding protein
MEEIMVAKVLGFAVGTMLFGIGTKLAEYGINKAEDKFKEFKEKNRADDEKEAEYRKKIFDTAETPVAAEG